MRQLALFDESEGRPPLPRPAPERDVLFYALLLGPQLWHPASRLVTALRQEHGLTGRMRSTDTFHISVLGFGFADELKDDDVDRAISIAGRTAFVPFEISFPRLMSFDSHRKKDDEVPLVLTAQGGSDQVLGLAKRLTGSMIVHGMKPRAFQPQLPHVTLLNDVIRVPPTELAAPLIVEIAGFSLVHSHRGQSRYSVLWSST
jgi:2'-5' RNA ligase